MMAEMAWGGLRRGRRAASRRRDQLHGSGAQAPVIKTSSTCGLCEETLPGYQLTPAPPTYELLAPRQASLSGDPRPAQSTITARSLLQDFILGSGWGTAVLTRPTAKWSWLGRIPAALHVVFSFLWHEGILSASLTMYDNMEATAAQPLRQIHALRHGSCRPAASSSRQASAATYLREQKLHESCLLEMCPADTWYHGSYGAGCPRPILVGQHHQQQLEELHEALTLAITDIVDRWWTDAAAEFPLRMPLPKEEEDLLQVSWPSCVLSSPVAWG